MMLSQSLALLVLADGIFTMSLGEDEFEEGNREAAAQDSGAAPESPSRLPLLSADMTRRIMQLCWSKFEVHSPKAKMYSQLVLSSDGGGWGEGRRSFLRKIEGLRLQSFHTQATWGSVLLLQRL